MPYKIIQTIEKGKYVLKIVPSKWEENGTLYWPRKNEEILRQYEHSEPDDNWLTYGCIMKRPNLETYQKGEVEVAKMNLQAELARGGEINSKSKRPRHLQQISSNGDNINDSEAVIFIQSIKSDIDENSQYDCGSESEINFTPELEHSSNPLGKLLHRLNVIIDNNRRIEEKLKSVQEQLEILNEGQQTLMHNMNHLNDQSKWTVQHVAENIDVNETIKSLEEFDNFESLLKIPEQEKALINKYSVICGVRRGRGMNNAYELVDAIFDRKFLTKCSWAGGSKTSESKIRFKSYTHVINFFFQLVHMSDNSVSLTDCHEFFKTILRNAQKRCESKFLRKSTTKNRGKKRKINDQTEPMEEAVEPQSQSFVDQAEYQSNESTDEDTIA